jgi:hypothetical protein
LWSRAGKGAHREGTLVVYEAVSGELAAAWKVGGV